jgi:hypothetical protein
MPLIEFVHELRGLFKRKPLGVWGIRDYYTRLEQIAEDGAQMTLGYLLMVLASTAMATGGLLMNSSAVVIGSMCVAPSWVHRGPCVSVDFFIIAKLFSEDWSSKFLVCLFWVQGPHI